MYGNRHLSLSAMMFQHHLCAHDVVMHVYVSKTIVCPVSLVASGSIQMLNENLKSS